MGSEQEEEEEEEVEVRKGTKVRHSPLTIKPLISSLKILTSHDTNTPPSGIFRIVWLLLLLGSQDPNLDTADTGRHLMRMESDNKGGSKSDETSEELTMRETGIIFPEKRRRKRETGNGSSESRSEIRKIERND